MTSHVPQKPQIRGKSERIHRAIVDHLDRMSMATAILESAKAAVTTEQQMKSIRLCADKLGDLQKQLIATISDE